MALGVFEYSGKPIDAWGAPGSGVAGPAKANRALDFSSAVGQGSNGPVAALTNASLGLGDVSAFTATIWFRARSRQAANIGPRVFLLGATDTTSDTGGTNSIGLKFQTASCLHFQLNHITAEADFVWSLPTNEWLFVAMVYDGASLVIYRGTELNPVELITAKPARAQVVSFGSNGALFIGNRRDRARAFHGWIDDFRFYNGAAGPDLVESIRRSALGSAAVAAIQRREEKAATSPSSDTSGRWVLVSAPAFSDALAPLVEHRRKNGLSVSVIETTNVLTDQQICAGDASPLKERLLEVFRSGKGARYLLLAGSAALDTPHPERTVVPMPPGSIARMKGQPTDFGYTLPDETGLPTIAVGRFPARTVEEMQAMVGKTLRLEQAPVTGQAGNGLLLIQGNPGGGPLAEAFVDGIAKPRLARLHPAWQFKAISHNSCSIFYLPTPVLHPFAVDYMSQGQLFSVYLGHSDRAGLSSNGTNFLNSADCARLNLGQGESVFFTCGCFACQADKGDQQAYGLTAMRNPNGPVAVIGAYGESYAAPGLLAADGLLHCCSEAPFPTRLADYWLGVQRGLAEGEMDQFTFNLLDMSDGTQQKVPLSVQRREHLEMWTLLGDPALRLPIVPLSISLRSVSQITPGRLLTLEGRLPEELKGADVRISVERVAGARPASLAPLPAQSPTNSAERERVRVENHRKVNERTLVLKKIKASGTAFSASLEIPEKLDSAVVVVRAYAEQSRASAQGILKLPVGAPAS